MSQVLPTTSPELPKPQEQSPILQNLEVGDGTTNKEKYNLPPLADRLSAASSAVSQATDDIQAQDSTLATQDNNIAPTNTTTQSASGLIADDVDVIEKVWVQKAKSVVNDTKDDPHKQSVGISHVKKDYLNKRFNKELKLPNG
jgi:hypothetical protein